MAYLSASGVRLARLYYAETDVPTLSSGYRHVLFELPDHLGSASFVIDKDTSELVEATRYEGYGSVESDYRPERWKSYRADYRFTGKEEDIEVGLAYFGARYYSPALNRWISADPLGVHQPGEADLNLYAFVHGRVYFDTDPNGLLAPLVFLAMVAIGAVVGGVSAAAAGGDAGAIALGAGIGAIAGAAGGAAGPWASTTLGPIVTSLLSITPEMGATVAGGLFGGGASAAASYGSNWAYAESQGKGQGYSIGGFFLGHRSFDRRAYGSHLPERH